jgi:LmbE family N-acetylglucosaminyl deacetylase
MEKIFKNKKIMLVVAHPDDEILGVGATIYKLIHEQNCKVRVVILGEGLTSRSNKRDSEKWQEELKHHRSNIYQAQKEIGYQDLSIYDFADNRFDSVPLLDIVKVIEKEKNIFKPEIIFTHHSGDLNIDHQRTFEAVITATRPMKDEIVKTIITFETPSATEWNYKQNSQFIPNLWVEISEDNLKAKQQAMSCYEFETRDYPHPRSIKALHVLAEKRGVETGVNLAESFCIIRSIV